jgi:hypothetical protein
MIIYVCEYRSFFCRRFYLPIGCGRALYTRIYMSVMFHCVDDETIKIGERLALSSEP